MNPNNLSNKQIFELSVIQNRYDKTIKAIEELPKKTHWNVSFLDEETEKAEKVLIEYSNVLYKDYFKILKHKNTKK